MRKDKLSDKQLNFCKEYIVDSNASAAYVRAKYSPNGANKLSSRLMAKDGIKAEISRLRAKQGIVLEHNRELSLSMLHDAYAIAERQANPAGMTAAVREMDSIHGLTSTTIHTDAPEQAQLDANAKAEAKRIASIRLRQDIA